MCDTPETEPIRQAIEEMKKALRETRGEQPLTADEFFTLFSPLLETMGPLPRLLDLTVEIAEELTALRLEVHTLRAQANRGGP